MKKIYRIHGFIGLVSVILGFLAKGIYREYIYAQGLNDKVIEGFLPSYFYVLGFSQLLLIRPTRYPWLIISIIMLASVLFEVYQFNSTHFLDVADMIASVAGGLTSLILMRQVQKNGTVANH
jgi:hypothetical protein